MLGNSFKIEGSIHSDEDMLIAGEVKGEIMCGKHIEIAKGGRVEGKIQCKSILIFGEIKGNVDAADSITIEATGRLIGDIQTRTLVNQPGGFFEGYSRMIKGEKSLDNVKEFNANKAKGKAV